MPAKSPTQACSQPQGEGFFGGTVAKNFKGQGKMIAAKMGFVRFLGRALLAACLR